MSEVVKENGFRKQKKAKKDIAVTINVQWMSIQYTHYVHVHSATINRCHISKASRAIYIFESVFLKLSLLYEYAKISRHPVEK